MIFAAIILLIFGWKKLRLIRKGQWKYIFYNAMLGTFLPVFLFTYAVLHVDSGIVAVLNSTTPLFTLITGLLLFHFSINFRVFFFIMI
jgi:drug/metabolite transporter (DMT)-like permease